MKRLILGLMLVGSGVVYGMEDHTDDTPRIPRRTRVTITEDHLNAFIEHNNEFLTQHAQILEANFIKKIKDHQRYTWQDAKRDLCQATLTGLGQGFAQPIGQVIAGLLVEGGGYLKQLVAPSHTQEPQDLREKIAYYQAMNQINRDTLDPAQKEAIQKMISAGVLSVLQQLNRL